MKNEFFDMRQNKSKMKIIMILFILLFLFVLQTVKALTGRQVLRRLISTYTASHSPFYRMLSKGGLKSPYNLSVYLAVFGLPVVSKRCVWPRVNN